MNFDSRFNNIPINRRCSNCSSIIKTEEKYCPHCGHLCDVNGWRECGTDRCGNCHEYLQADDKYCRFCGTKAGEGKYEPFLDIMQCIYGPPPVERTHKCKKCGHLWTSILMVDNEKYCPMCGNDPAEVTVKFETEW